MIFFLTLHIHLGAVDEILQGVGTGIIIFELSIIGDYLCSWIIGVHNTTDVKCVDAGEVSVDPCASCTGCLETTLIIKPGTEKNSKCAKSVLFKSSFSLY